MQRQGANRRGGGVGRVRGRGRSGGNRAQRTGAAPKFHDKKKIPWAKRGKNTSSTSEREWEWDGSIMNTYCITIDGETNPYCKLCEKLIIGDPKNHHKTAEHLAEKLKKHPRQHQADAEGSRRYCLLCEEVMTCGHRQHTRTPEHQAAKLKKYPQGELAGEGMGGKEEEEEDDGKGVVSKPYCRLCEKVLTGVPDDHCRGAEHQAKKSEAMRTMEELEGKGKGTKTVSKPEDEGEAKSDKRSYCKICKIFITINQRTHQQSAAHKEQKLMKFPLGKLKCSSCNFTHQHQRALEDHQRVKHGKIGDNQHKKNSKAKAVGKDDPTTVKSTSHSTKRNETNNAKKAKSDHSQEILNAFAAIPNGDPCPVMGVDQVIPMNGFYCNVCRKFFRDEFEVKVTHCRSKPHRDKYEEGVKNGTIKSGVVKK